jgi:hypothetical protein
MWYRRLACSYFFLLEEQARRLYHTLFIKKACIKDRLRHGSKLEIIVLGVCLFSAIMPNLPIAI